MTKTEFSWNLCRVKVYFVAEKEVKLFKTNVCVQKYILLARYYSLFKCRDAWIQGLHKGSNMFKVDGSLICLSSVYCILGIKIKYVQLWKSGYCYWWITLKMKGRKIKNTTNYYQNYICQLYYKGNVLLEYSLNMTAQKYWYPSTELVASHSSHALVCILSYLVGSGGFFIEYVNVIWLFTNWHGIISQRFRSST